MANRPMAGYPQPVGAKYEMVIDHDGPASYNNTGVTLTSGETINASDLGFGGIEYAEADAVSSDGINYVYIMNLNQSTSGPMANALPSVVLRWFVLATGLEVANAVNLSGKSIRVRLRLV